MTEEELPYQFSPAYELDMIKDGLFLETATPITSMVAALAKQHRFTWRMKGKWGWLFGLCEEVAELGLSLAGWHRHPPEWEMMQIAAICVNWMKHRRGDKISDIVSVSNDKVRMTGD